MTVFDTKGLDAAEKLLKDRWGETKTFRNIAATAIEGWCSAVPPDPRISELKNEINRYVAQIQSLGTACSALKVRISELEKQRADALLEYCPIDTAPHIDGRQIVGYDSRRDTVVVIHWTNSTGWVIDWTNKPYSGCDMWIPIPFPGDFAMCTDYSVRIAELETQNRALAADQCHDGYGDEGGSHRCRYQDRIAALEAQNERLRDALKPFAHFAEARKKPFSEKSPDSVFYGKKYPEHNLFVRDFLAAHEALAETKGKNDDR